MHDQRRPVETVVEVAYVGIDLETVRHLAVPIRNHAVSGNDGVAFDARTPSHRVSLRYVMRTRWFSNCCKTGSRLEATPQLVKPGC